MSNEEAGSVSITTRDTTAAMEAQGIVLRVSVPISPAEVARLYWRWEIMPKTMRRLA